MGRPTKSLNPRDRMGVYKHLSDVPDRYRLHHHAAAYDGRDVWHEFCVEYEYAQGSHERYQEEVDRVGSHWQAFMDERDRHHALATPDDVEQWCADLLAERSPKRTYEYYLRIHRFYDWLQWHTEHPHVYNPALMAAVEGEATGQAWEWKARRTRERREHYRSEAHE